MIDHGLIIDLFAGGGGASVGLENALRAPVDIAINHDPVALAVHKANHPSTQHLVTDIWDVKPLQATKGRPVAVLWASPDCTHFSVAKGGKPRSGKIRSLAWVVVRWAKEVRPAVIFLENVTEFKGWGPLGGDNKPDKARMGQTFRAWRRKLERMGYQVDYRVLDASQYGAPTKRRRLFLVARCDGQAIEWPEPTHGPQLIPLHTAAECIDWSLPCPSIFTRKKPLAKKTLWRIAQGIKRFVIEDPQPFILNLSHGGRLEPLTEPMRTLTATPKGGSRALVVPTIGKRRKVAAFIARHFGERQGGFAGGVAMERPLPSVTTKDHNSLAAVTLVKLRGKCHGAQLTLPLPTLTAGGTHLAEVRAFLTTYYGTDGPKGQSLRRPMRTARTKACLGLVWVEGTAHQIIDIGMRMLEPHELLAAQFGKYAGQYDLTQAKTKTAKVRLIGNSVCPEAAEAVLRANVHRAPGARRKAA